MLPLSECAFHTCYVSSSPYGYQPSLALNVIFLVLFGFGLGGCILTALWTRRSISFSIPLSLACVSEIIGYGVRTANWMDPWDVRYYAMSTVFFTTAPSLVSIAVYSTIKMVAEVLESEHHTFIHPRSPTRFIVADLASIALQIIGFHIALRDVSTEDGFADEATLGGHIVAVGLLVQALTLAFFISSFAIPVFRAAYVSHGHVDLDSTQRLLVFTVRPFVVVLSVAAACLMIRGFYRAHGLAQNFDGGTRDEMLFAVFDSSMVVEAVLALVVFHPGRMLGSNDNVKRSVDEKKADSTMRKVLGVNDGQDMV